MRPPTILHPRLQQADLVDTRPPKREEKKPPVPTWAEKRFRPPPSPSRFQRDEALIDEKHSHFDEIL
jgi:hypothetical protein